ncbi:VanZ family protein [Brevibacillus choshinensis]|uniref:VanZ family protein n=1 Tax=Brevibacillus choshinensis TaxID=54911 RepID=A0ABR5N0F1_BRECH|nr:VanZ family protein [Brevibacillus choshinensis]KQL43983.1 VanZ family protein [Brevibacillus choshinensis]
MMEMKIRKPLFAGTLFYISLILYFMFFAFNRVEHATDVYGYVFMLVPEAVPLLFPEFSFSWLYDFGNIAAFIPFGTLFPLLYRIRFVKFITFFISAILVLETLQALTHLGSFDVDDVISNTLGAAIGFVAYKVGFASKISYKKLLASALSIGVLLIGIMVVSETVHYALEKREGPIQALHGWKERNGRLPRTTNLSSFTVKGKKIEPKMNVYSSQGEKSKTYTYILGNKKNVKFYSHYGIPDNGERKGEVTVIADGQLIAQFSELYMQDADTFEMPFDQINEITITVSGNAELWDAGLSERKHWWE